MVGVAATTSAQPRHAGTHPPYSSVPRIRTWLADGQLKTLAYHPRTQHSGATNTTRSWPNDV